MSSDRSDDAEPHQVRRPRRVAMPATDTPGLLSMSFEELGALIAELGEKPYRARQLFTWLHEHGASDFEEMTSLSKDLRHLLAERTRLDGLTLDSVAESTDGTRKIVLSTVDGHQIETVLIPAEDRLTQCLSSQVGCRIGCTFCLTATMPIQRNLTAGEIVDQVYHARRVLGPDGPRITHVVYMGMGEPLDNLENVVRSCELLMDERGRAMSPRRITVSTSGLADGLRELGDRLSVNIALSLNASDDDTRSRIIPINRKYPISMLMSTLRKLPRRPRQKLTVEYVLLGGVNDRDEDARRLAQLVRGSEMRVNLIPFNPYPGALFERPLSDRVDAFGRMLRDAGVRVTVRQSRGRDIGAACGMLDAGEVEPGSASSPPTP